MLNFTFELLSCFEIDGHSDERDMRSEVLRVFRDGVDLGLIHAAYTEADRTLAVCFVKDETNRVLTALNDDGSSSLAFNAMCDALCATRFVRAICV